MKAAKVKKESHQKREHKFSVDGRRHVWIIDGECFDFRAPKDEDAYYLDYEEGEKWVEFFRCYLCHTEGDLQGQDLELLPWAEAVVRELFGWKKKKDGGRRYQTAFILVPGKNGKTQLGMGLALGLTAIDGEKGAQVYWAASTKDQANRTCWKMIQDLWALDESLDLRKEMKMHDSGMAVGHPKSRSKMQIISSTPKGKHGFNVHAAILDEIHETSNDAVRNVLRAKMTTRKKPLLIYITTAGDSKTHWSHKEYEKAKDIDQGKTDTYGADRTMVFIREADESVEKDLNKPEVLKAALIAANPGLGKSVLMENLLLQWEEAQGEPAKIDMFLQCQLNMWVERYSDYLPRGAWELCAESFSLKEMLGRDCFVGVDLSESKDMTAISLVFPYWEDLGGSMRVSYRVVPYYFIPQATFDNEEKYHAWIKHDLEVAGIEIIEYATVRSRVKHQAKELYKGQKVLLDPAYANEFATALRDTDEIPVEYVRQKGWQTAAAVRRFRELVMSGQIKHQNNPIFNWNIQNAKVVRDKYSDQERLSKLNSAGKIDGLMATIFALHGALDYSPPKDVSSHFKNGWSM